MKDRKLRDFLVCLSLTLIASIIWSEGLLSQRNIVAFKKDWRLATLDFLNPTIVGVPAYVSPVALQGYRLKSDGDLGIIRLLSEDVFRPEELKAWFRLKENGFVDIIINSVQGAFTSVRISRSEYFPSALIRSDSSEKYLEMSPVGTVPDEGLHTAVIRNGVLELDGKEMNIPGLQLPEGHVGVQVSPGNSEVFALRVSEKNNSRYLHFLPDGNRFALYGRHWAILFALVLLAGIMKRVNRVRVAAFLVAAGLLFLLSDVLIGIDRKKSPHDLREKFKVMDGWWVPPGDKALSEKFTALKKDDADSVIFLCRKSGCEKVRLVDLPPKQNERILIFGGSQSKYGLIRKYEESFHFQFDQVLRKERPDIETINLSTPGFFRDRLAAYGKALEKVAPDTIIVESLVMPEDRSHLRSFLEETRKRGIRTVLLRTPQNLMKFTDAEIPFLLREIPKGLDSRASGFPGMNKWLALNNVSFLAETKKDTGFIFLDPNQIFLDESVRNSGQLFWDATHLSIYGQKVLAEWTGSEILRLK